MLTRIGLTKTDNSISITIRKIMHEQKIISTLLASREAFEAVNEHLDSSDFSAESNLLVEYIRDYYHRDDRANSVDVDIILGSLKRRLVNPKHFQAMETVLKNLPDASPGNVAKEILEVKRHSQGLKLAAALSGGR